MLYTDTVIVGTSGENSRKAGRATNSTSWSRCCWRQMQAAATEN